MTTEDADAINEIIEKLSDTIDEYEIELSEEDEAFLEEFAGKFNEANIQTVEEKEITADNINDKIKEAEKGDTITLTNDISADVVIPEGKEITLEIPENVTLSNKNGHTITNNGDLTITGDGIVCNVSHAKAPIYNSGTLTINGGTFDRTFEEGTYNPDKSNGNSWYTVYNAKNATVTINDGTFKNSGGYSSMLDNWGDLTIKDGDFSGGKNTIKNDDTGTIVIEGGEFSNDTQAVLLNWHNLTVKGGTFTAAENKWSIFNGTDNGVNGTTNGNVTIKGGTFSGDIGEFDYSKTTSEGKETLTIDGGDLTEVGTIEAVVGTTLKITKNAKLSDDVTIYVRNADSVTLPTPEDAEKGIFVGWISQIEEEVVKYDGTVPNMAVEFKQSWLKLEAEVEDDNVSDSTTGVDDEKVKTAEDVAKSSASAVVKEILNSSSEAETDISVYYELVKADAQNDEYAKEELKNKIINAVIYNTPITTKVEVTDVEETDIAEDVKKKIEAAVAELPKSDTADSTDTTTENSWKVVSDSFINIDINMYVAQGENEEKKVARLTQVNNEIDFSIAIPESLRSKNNEYKVVRYHGDEADILDAKKSSDGTKVVFSSNLFSYYGLVYKEAAVDNTDDKKDDSNTDNNNTDNNSSNNDSSNSNGGSSSGSRDRDKGISKITGQWIMDDKGWWYRLSNGSYPRDSWYECTWNGILSWYHFNAEGYADGGWFTDNDGQRYYLHDVHDGTFGAMYTGWKQIVDQWYYFNPEKRADGASKGSLVMNGVTPDGYAVDANGAWIH